MTSFWLLAWKTSLRMLGSSSLRPSAEFTSASVLGKPHHTTHTEENNWQAVNFCMGMLVIWTAEFTQTSLKTNRKYYLLSLNILSSQQAGSKNVGFVISGILLKDKCLLARPHTARLTAHILEIKHYEV